MKGERSKKENRGVKEKNKKRTYMYLEGSSVSLDQKR